MKIAETNHFFPDLYLNSVFDADYHSLYRRGIRGLVFDIDNTLAEINEAEPCAKVTELFQRLQGMGFQLCLLSNNKEPRVQRFNSSLKVHAIHKAAKPGSRGILQAMGLMGTTAESTAMLGDQVFTDVWCGKRHGLYTVLVRPVGSRDEFAVRLKRYPEKIVLALYRSKLKGNMRKGVTLIELVVVMSVITVCLAAASVSASAMDTRVLNSVCLQLQSDLRFAQRSAVIEGRTYEVVFDVSKDRYYTAAAGNGLSKNMVKDVYLDSGIDLVSTTAVNGRVSYTTRGTTGDACTITLRDNKYSVTLTVNVGSGRIEQKKFVKL